jgi:hypothetical protein
MDARSVLTIESLRNNIRSSNLRAYDFNDVAASDSTVSGKFTVNGSGEARAHVLFPVSFSVLPYMTFGFEVQSSTQILKQHAPAMSATVYDWDTLDRPPFSRFYKGASLLVVSSGPSDLKFICSWSATGTAFTSPSV